MNRTFTRILSGILLVFLMLNGWGIAQAKIPADSERQLTEVLSEISERYQVIITYDAGTVEGIKVDYQAKELPSDLESVLKMVMKQTNLEYRSISSKYYVIYRDDFRGRRDIRKLERKMRQIQKIESSGNISLGRKQAKENSHFSDLLKSARRLAPDNIDISGTVTDEEGELLIGVNIQVKGTNKGTATDFDGHFTLDDIDEDAILIVSYVGYQTKEVAVNGKSELEIVLSSDAEMLDEIIVVGYGTQKRANVIGSVTSIGTEELTVAPVSNVSNAIAGKLPGAVVQQGSGEPGSAASILIRGSSTLGDNSPLVVIDGIPDRDLNSLQPSEIENVTILKDASAAIYGARAANGVILITTKRGKTGAPRINYSFFNGWNTPTMFPEMTDAPTYAQLIREVQSYRGIAEEDMDFSKEDVEKFASGDYPWTHPNTDWRKASLRKFAPTNSHNLSIDGGTDNTTYRVALGKIYDGGMFHSDAISYDRYNLSANSDMKVNKYLDVGIGLILSQENRMSPSKSIEDIFGSIIRNKPTMFATYPNGFPGLDIEYGNQPVINTTYEGGFNDNKNYTLNGNIFANLIIPKVEGLSLSGYYAYDMAFKVKKLLEQPITLYEMNTSAYLNDGNTGVEDGSDYLTPAVRGTIADPRVTDSYDDIRRSTFNLRASYQNNFNDVHDLDAFVAIEGMDYLSKGIEGYRRYFLSDELPYLFAGGDEEKDNDAWVSLDSRLNYFGRISYSYDEKYLFQFSLRRDGSVRFSEENGRWGNFPSVLIGWNVSNENFWKNNIDFVRYLKVRTSWGKMGNDAVSAFQYLTNFGFADGTTLGNRTYFTGLEKIGEPNPFITWEVANVFNIGFESYLWRDKVYLEFDYFFERRKDILVQRNASVPRFTGLSLPDENFGIVDNSGFELVLGLNDKIGSFSWGFRGNLAFAKNKIVEFDEPEVSVPWQRLTGSPMGSTLLYNSIGIFRDEAHIESYPHVPGARPGDIIIEDVNGDGRIDSDDKILWTETATPQVTYGFSFNFGFKRFSLQGMIQGVGRTMRQMYTDDRQGTSGNYFNYDAVGRWTPDNIDAKKPRIFERYEEYWRDSYRTNQSYHNQSFARLKNLEISYSIPENLEYLSWLTGGSVFISGQNLALLYSGNGIMDPEVQQDNFYPLMKSYAIGIRISL